MTGLPITCPKSDKLGILDGTLLEHCLRDLHEAGDVGALHIIDGAVRTGSVLDALLVDAFHDPVKLVVDFLCGPAEVSCILGHFETGGSDTTCVDSLSRGEEDAVVLEEVDSARLASHVGHLAAAPATVGLEFLRVILAELVLESARESNVARDAPSLLASDELGLLREPGSHILDHVPVGSAHVEHIVIHLRSHSVRNVADTVRTGDSDDLSTKLGSLHDCAPSDVTEAGDADLLVLDVLSSLAEKVLGEIEGTETGSLRTEDGSTPGSSLSGEDAGVVLAGELLVHSVEESDLTATYTYVTCRDVLVRTDAAPEFEHEGLAETHDFGI